jgi:hypothetical protein
LRSDSVLPTDSTSLPDMRFRSLSYRALYFENCSGVLGVCALHGYSATLIRLVGVGVSLCVVFVRLQFWVCVAVRCVFCGCLSASSVSSGCWVPWSCSSPQSSGLGGVAVGWVRLQCRGRSFGHGTCFARDSLHARNSVSEEGKDCLKVKLDGAVEVINTPHHKGILQAIRGYLCARTAADHT